MKFYLNCGWKQFQSVNDLRSYAMLVGAAAKERPENSGQGPVSQKSRKAICKTPTHLFCKAGLLIRCKGNEN